MISPAELGTLLAELPPPMLLGPVELADGRGNVGFGPVADTTGEDVTSTGDSGGLVAAARSPTGRARKGSLKEAAPAEWCACGSGREAV